MPTREEQISKQRQVMPEMYRATYDRAVNHESMRAAVNARCLGCTAWQRTEVRDCPALSCPLWAYRPYRETRQNRRESQGRPVEATERKETPLDDGKVGQSKYRALNSVL